MNGKQAPGVLNVRGCRLLGLTGTSALALGSVSGAGALPVQNMPQPSAGYPALGLFASYFGLVLLIGAWLCLGRLVERETGATPSPRELQVTLIIWAIPLVLAPPLFSRDIYSYLAQGAMVNAHMNVYASGPDQLGGTSNQMVANIAPMWRGSPAPYGPVFLKLAGMLEPAGLLGMRLLALAGVALMIVLLPVLAKRCGCDPAAALWLGGLNPLVLQHLIGGAHNDAVMLGLLGAGLLAALSGSRHGNLSGSGRGILSGGSRGSQPVSGAKWYTVGWPVAAATLVTLAALVKAPAALGLVAVGSLWSSRLTGRWRSVRAALATTAVAAVVTAAVTALAGTGYGWISALGTPVTPYNWAPIAALGRLTGRLLVDAGSSLAPLVAPMWRLVGLAATAVVAALAWRHRARLGAVYALGVSLAAAAVLAPAIRPWYLLWGLFLIAAAAPPGRTRRWTAAVSGILALVVLPSGSAADAAELKFAVAGGALAAVASLCVLGLDVRARDVHTAS
jgi:alpha-1,6-mannosyltransferase